MENLALGAGLGEKGDGMKAWLYKSGGLALALGLALGLPAAQAIERGTTASGMAYVSGGVGEAEIAALQGEKDRYSFWLTTAVKRSGAHLAGVRVRITDTTRKVVVLEHTLDGPWLLCALPPGRYDIQAAYRESAGSPEQTRTGGTTIHAGDHHQMVLYFDTPDETDPERVLPPAVSGRGGKP